MPALAIAIFVAVFAIATFRKIHLGAQIVAGFPVSILVLLAGVTFFFGIAQAIGTIDRIVEKLLGPFGAKRGPLTAWSPACVRSSCARVG